MYGGPIAHKAGDDRASGLRSQVCFDVALFSSFFDGAKNLTQGIMRRRGPTVSGRGDERLPHAIIPLGGVEPQPPPWAVFPQLVFLHRRATPPHINGGHSSH